MSDDPPAHLPHICRHSLRDGSWDEIARADCCWPICKCEEQSTPIAVRQEQPESSLARAVREARGGEAPIPKRSFA